MFKTKEQIIKSSEYESEILDLIESGREELTTSDLQGVVSVIVYKIAHDKALSSN